jgi:Zn-dependent M28 family amino/carboxypeptidase
MISAHHDHLGVKDGAMYRGADDNASGMAVLLGIARAAQFRTYKHTILFVSFGAEEDGLVGSGVYVKDPVWPLDKTRGLINFDMVGRNFFETGADQPSTVAVVGLEDTPRVRGTARAAADKVAMNMIEVPARLLELFQLHDRTDDWWFRRQNIASIHFSTGLHQDYHQVSDTPEKIIPLQLERIAYIASAVLDEMAILKKRR